MKYIKNWFRDFWQVFTREFRAIFSDTGVLVVFFVAGLGYPILYNMIYANGNLEDMSVVVVDEACCSESRRFASEVDATREVRVSGKCESLAEAQDMMERGKCHGIIWFPSDFGEKIALGQQSQMSVFCDMGSFFYYKNLMTATNLVMLSELHQISPQIRPLDYHENNLYNRSNAFNFFFITAALMLVIQQTMFYGMGMLAGTRAENFNKVHGKAPGIRNQLAQAMVYWLIYMMIGMYIIYIVPSFFNIPHVTEFWTSLVFLSIYIAACVAFCQVFSLFFRHRETPIVALLFLTLPELFLTGFSWPQACFPRFWNWFSYLFPSTFGARAYINLAGCGASLSTIAPLLRVLLIQSVVYFTFSFVIINAYNKRNKMI